MERLYKELDDAGLSKNTYVAIVGDHGEVGSGGILWSGARAVVLL